MKWRLAHFTYGIAIRGYRCGLTSGMLILPNWLADKTEAVMCDKGNADLTILFDAIEIARWTVEAERPPRSSLS